MVCSGFPLELEGEEREDRQEGEEDGPEVPQAGMVDPGALVDPGVLVDLRVLGDQHHLQRRPGPR